MPHYETQSSEISSPTRYVEGGMVRTQERLRLLQWLYSRVHSGGRRGRSLHKLNPLDEEHGASGFHLEQGSC